MNKFLYIATKVVFTLIILFPILSLIAIAFGYDVEPKREYYATDEAYDFIVAIMNSGYITVLNAVVFALGIILAWTKRTALAALLVLPVTVNIVAFHAMLDGGLFTGGAVLGDILLITNLALMWYHRGSYASLIAPSTPAVSQQTTV